LFKKCQIAIFFAAVCSIYAGFVDVHSSPSGATILIDGESTHLVTPNIIEIFGDSVDISVSLDDYYFQKRIVRVPKNDTMRISFTQMQIFDTVSIFGHHSYGILNLPKPPNGIPYLIDGYIEHDYKKILLNAGEHSINWSGGMEYEPIDTSAEITAGRITDVEFEFNYRTATLSIETKPEDAKIFLDGKLTAVGVLFGKVSAGKHKIAVSAKGYVRKEQEIIVFPNHTAKLDIVLEPATGMDYTEKRIDSHGNFKKPKRIDELKNLGRFWGNYLISQPFSIEVSALSVQYRTATDKKFRDIVSLFNDASLIGTNYRGFSFFNKLWIAKSFVIFSAEYGQGFGGIKYKKPYEINIEESSPRYENNYLIYDYYSEINPEIIFRSYSGQIGFRAGDKIISVAILTGFQREKIIFSGLSQKTSDEETYYTSFEQQNNNWITSVRAVVSPKSANFYPSFYAELSLTPVRNYDVSGWTTVRSGILVPWRFERKK